MNSRNWDSSIINLLLPFFIRYPLSMFSKQGCHALHYRLIEPCDFGLYLVVGGTRDELDWSSSPWERLQVWTLNQGHTRTRVSVPQERVEVYSVPIPYSSPVVPPEMLSSNQHY